MRLRFQELFDKPIRFSVIKQQLGSNPQAVITATDEKGWTLLHYLAKAEVEHKNNPSAIQEIEELTQLLLTAGMDVHQEAKPGPGQKTGDTAFNVAAPAS